MSFTFCRSSSSLWKTETQFIILHDIPADCFRNCACSLITVVLYLTEGFSLKMSSNTFPDLQQTPAILTLSFHKIHLLQRATRVGTCPSCLTTLFLVCSKTRTFFFTALAGVVQYFLLIFCNKVADYTLDIVRTDGRFFWKKYTPQQWPQKKLSSNCVEVAVRLFLSLLSLPLFKYAI